MYTITKNNLSIGTLTAHFGKIIPDFVFTPEFGPDSTATYELLVNAQNTGVFEQLFFRRTQDLSGVEYRYDVVRDVLAGQQKKGDIYTGKKWIRFVKRQPWTKP